MHWRYTAVENIVRKGEIACSKHFLLFSQCFLPYMALIFHFKCTFECLTVFSILSKREIIILSTFDLSSANAFNLVTFKNFFVWLRLKQISPQYDSTFWGASPIWLTQGSNEGIRNQSHKITDNAWQKEVLTHVTPTFSSLYVIIKLTSFHAYGSFPVTHYVLFRPIWVCIVAISQSNTWGLCSLTRWTTGWIVTLLVL